MPDQRREEKSEGGSASAARAEHGAGVLQLLDREPPSGYVRERTDHVYRKVETVEPGALSVFVFRIGVEWLALPTAVIQEIANAQNVHSIPHRHGGALMGLVSVRGELLICVSLGALLGLEAAAEPIGEKGENTGRRLLVANREAQRVAFPVEEVYGVQRHQPEDLREVPTTFSKVAATYTTGLLPWRDKTVGCLDDALLFYALNKSLS
jgi:chemotaxis-related protein WspD